MAAADSATESVAGSSSADQVADKSAAAVEQRSAAPSGQQIDLAGLIPPGTPELISPGYESPTASRSQSEPEDGSPQTALLVPARDGCSQQDGSQLQRQLAMCRLLLKRGQAKEALASLEAAGLARLPVDALCLRGQCLATLGDNAGAFASFMAVLAQRPRHMDALLSCATLHRACGSLLEAAGLLKEANEEAGGKDYHVTYALATVLTDIGISMQIRQDSAAAQQKYEEALAVCEGYAPAHYSQGVLLAAQAKADEAIKAYQKAVNIMPNYAEAHCNMGVLHKQAGRLNEAIDAYETAVNLAPCANVIRNNLAVAYNEKGIQLKLESKGGAAVCLFEKALALQPTLPQALYSMACVYFEAGQYERASFFYETSLTYDMRNPDAWNNLGVVQRNLRNLERAAQCYQAALNLRPNFPEALNNMAVMYTYQGRSHDAAQLLNAVLISAPEYAEAWNTLGVLQRDLGTMQEAVTSYKRCMELAPTQRNSFQNYLLALNSIMPGEQPEVCAAHAEWGKNFQHYIDCTWPAVSMRGHNAHDKSLDRPLIVGYVSADLFTHSVSYFAEGPITHHDPSRVRCIVYACVPRPDAKTVRLKAAVQAAHGTWHDVDGLSEEALAEKVREDGVDILVELAGQTAHNRLGTMAMRPAPIQATWIGYPNSTGLPSVTYRLTDKICDPTSTTQTFTETLNKPFACAATRAAYLSQLEEQGMDPARVDLMPLTQGTQQHLTTYHDMDISLDPFPYTGTTTTAESLLMGVPVITCTGACHAHNVSASLMQTVGLPGSGWVASNEQEYIDAATQAVADLDQLNQLRAALRERMLQSPLCNSADFTVQLEKVYRRMWETWVEDGKPLQD
ncbi:hypothetical protein WJX73_005990 [Symbiochloris irregularis]|uniref:protein O-GlcNAc transferase n=1 Tax=Symbiochloris irregularis TaxID=706552 RepID=A0AAW1Q2G7_9CHLO